MDELSELEQLLQNQVLEGHLDSAGHFTLAREKALEKLASFQLPRETAWISKLVQAAVAGGATELVVFLNRRDTQLGFPCPEHWTLELLENAFYDPEICGERALDHWKRGLWPVAIRDQRPFRLCLPGQSQALLWTGESLQHSPGRPVGKLELTIAHRSRLGGKGVANSDLLNELRHFCFTCPVPLRVNGRRLDALQGCPMHGFQRTSYPVRAAFAAAALPGFPIPKLTAAGYNPFSPGDASLSSIFEAGYKAPARVGVGMLLSASVEKTTMGGATALLARKRPSAISWVLDGVVIERVQLEVGLSSCSVGLFVNAEGMETDLSGFALVKDEEYRLRQAVACRAVLPLVKAARISLDFYVKSVLKIAYGIGGSLLLGGLGLAITIPLSGFFVAVGGVVGSAAVSASVHRSPERRLEMALQRDLRALREEWVARWD